MEKSHQNFQKYAIDLDEKNTVTLLKCRHTLKFIKHFEYVESTWARSFTQRLIFKDTRTLDLIQSSQPVLFLANHQVSMESHSFNVILRRFYRSPLIIIAKKRDAKALIFFNKFLSALTKEGYLSNFHIIPIDTENPRQSILDLREAFALSQQYNASIFIHAQGTREKSEGEQITTLSSSLLRLASRLQYPIVPVRFCGALPSRPLKKSIFYPISRQIIFIGSPITLDSNRPLKDQKTKIISILNKMAIHSIPLKPSRYAQFLNQFEKILPLPGIACGLLSFTAATSKEKKFKQFILMFLFFLLIPFHWSPKKGLSKSLIDAFRFFIRR